MALSKSSVLHYWSSRYGINPRIGGRPVFTRNSAGLFTTQEGEVDTAIVNTPRFDWATLNLPNSLTERRKVLTLELASTNIIDSEMGTWSPTGTISETAGQADPMGGTAAKLQTGTSAGSSWSKVFGFTGNGTKALSIRLKPGTVTNTGFGIFDNTAGVYRGHANIPWSGGVPGAISLDTAGGLTIFPVRALTGGYYEILIAIPGIVAANSNSIYFHPAGVSGSGTVFTYRPQAENLAFPTSMINGFSTTRATDSCYWNFPPVPQGFMAYSRHVEQGTVLLANNTRVWFIGSAANGVPQITADASSGFYDAGHNAGTGGVASLLGVAPAIGDTVELLLIAFPADGSVQIIQSINGAAVTAAGQSGAVPGGPFAAAWSDTRLYANSTGASFVGSAKLAELKLVKYADVVASTAQGRMDEMRAFELGPNADVL